MPPVIRVTVMPAKNQIHKISNTDILRVATGYLQQVQDKVTDYPPPSSTYKRTGAYGQHWAVDPFEAKITNSVVYSGRVGGYKTHGTPEQRQTKVLAGKGWASIETIAQDLWKKYYKGVIKKLVFMEQIRPGG